MAKTALESKADLVIACGGDGTVREVAATLQHTKVPLGILPLGTGNVLARNLDIPHAQLSKALDVAFGHHVRAVDVGVASLTRTDGSVDEEVFLAMSGVGLDAEIMSATQSKLKRLFGWVAYLGAALQVVNKQRSYNAKIGTEHGEPVKVRAHTILVGNCGTMPGNIILLPEAKIDDGQLDIVAMSPKSIFGWLPIGHRVLVEHTVGQTPTGKAMVQFGGGGKPLRQLTYRTGEHVDIWLQEQHPAEVDGDVAGDVTHFAAHTERGALLVKVP